MKETENKSFNVLINFTAQDKNIIHISQMCEEKQKIEKKGLYSVRFL